MPTRSPFAAATLALVLASPVGADRPEDPVDSPARLADGLVLETLDGLSFDLGSLRGERVLIVTWASW